MAIIVNPQSELIREPNLLEPGKRPNGSVKLQMPPGVHIDQWLDGPRTLNSNKSAAKTVNADATLVRGKGVAFNDVGGASEKDHYTIYSVLSKTITTRPFGFIGVFTSLANSSDYTNYYGHCGILKNTTSSSIKSYCRGYMYKGKPTLIKTRVGFGTETSVSTTNLSQNNLFSGDKFEIGFMSDSVTSHTSYARINRGPIDTGTSSEDRTGETLDYDSISIGASADYDNSQITRIFPEICHTVVVVQGPGVTDAFMKDLIKDPYQYLVPW